MGGTYLEGVQGTGNAACLYVSTLPPFCVGQSKSPDLTNRLNLQESERILPKPNPKDIVMSHYGAFKDPGDLSAPEFLGFQEQRRASQSPFVRLLTHFFL